jgi:L-aspartate oxidase
MAEHETGTLVIGSGIAGLSASIALADAGADVTLITAAPSLHETNTLYAQGGIIYRTLQADPDQLIEDILEAGARINYGPAVRQLATEGPALVKALLIDRLGVAFDRDSDEEYHLTREGGHSASRILHRGDESGKSIEEALVAYCRQLPRLRVLTGTTAVNLLMSSHHGLDRSRLHEPGRCFGAFVFDQASGETYPIFARDTVLATGGVGRLFLHNTNSQFARGDGIALAYRAGCRLENLEYVQFHPTTFFQASSPRFLISEALRGEGAVLVNQAGDRFLFKYLPDYPVPELAPRDRVSKAIHQEMLGQGAACVYLDISHRPADWIRERFPFVYRSCQKFGVDITAQPIPVVPGAHYHCGGVWTDLDGRTTVPGLWAVGEVACTGLHGANRLASTSLLEGLVWGTRAGRAIGESCRESAPGPHPRIAPWESGVAQVDPSFLSQDWMLLQHTMWNYAGLIKTDARLSRAEGILTELNRGIQVFYRQAKLSDALIGLRHATLVALRILEACKANRRSTGCYQRESLEI